MTAPARTLGTRTIALTMAGVVIGSGIFGLPGLAAQAMGAAALIGYLICVVILALVGLCLAETASRVDSVGGMIGYAEAAYGPRTSTVVGVLLVVADGLVPNSAVAVLMMSTLALAFPVLAEPLPRAGFLLLFYGLLVWSNVRGVRYGATLSEGLTAIKLLPLVALVVLGLPHIHLANLVWHSMPPLRVVGQTTVLLFFAFMGFEASLPISAEARDPSRTVPRAIFAAIALVATLYIGLQVVAQGVLGDALATSGAAPLGETARAIFGSFGGQLIVWATILSTAGLLASDAIGSPRAVQALGLSGVLPRAIGERHPVYHTPANAIYAYHAVSLAVALFLPFRFLVTFGAAGTLAMYLIASIGVLRLRARKVRLERAPFTVPGGMTVPVLAAGIILTVLLTLARAELLTLLALITAGLLLRLVRPARSLSLDGSNT